MIVLPILSTSSTVSLCPNSMTRPPAQGTRLARVVGSLWRAERPRYPSQSLPHLGPSGNPGNPAKCERESPRSGQGDVAETSLVSELPKPDQPHRHLGGGWLAGV